jgi:hypothetical protein
MNIYCVKGVAAYREFSCAIKIIKYLLFEFTANYRPFSMSYVLQTLESVNIIFAMIKFGC